MATAAKHNQHDRLNDNGRPIRASVPLDQRGRKAPDDHEPARSLHEQPRSRPNRWPAHDWFLRRFRLFRKSKDNRVGDLVRGPHADALHGFGRAVALHVARKARARNRPSRGFGRSHRHSFLRTSGNGFSGICGRRANIFTSPRVAGVTAARRCARRPTRYLSHRRRGLTTRRRAASPSRWQCRRWLFPRAASRGSSRA